MSATSDVESGAVNGSYVSTGGDAPVVVTIVAPVAAEPPAQAPPAPPSETSTATTTTIATITIGEDAKDLSNANAPQIANGGGENDGNALLQQSSAAAETETILPPPTTTTTTTTTVTTTTVIAKDKMDSEPMLANFKALYVLAQLCGLTMVVLVGSWVGVYFGGVAGTANPSVEFNWHPVLMTIGLIFLYGNSILIYRGFRTVRKKTLKLTHAGLHLTAFVLVVLGLVAVFDSHNLVATPIPNMYSLHSWLGLGTVILFCMQYVLGFATFLYPGLRDTNRAALMPWHVYFGLFGFVLAIASALMGVTEKAIFSIANYSAMPSSGVMANLIGIMFVIFGGLVIYLATEPKFKRKPLPEDAALMTGADE